MTTKEQEKQALDKIRKIVDGLGENSYIGTAFEGCFDIAEENICNDWACSMKQRVEKAEKDRDYFEKAANHESEELEKTRNEIADLKRQLDKTFNTDEIMTIRGILQNCIRNLEVAYKSSAERVVLYADDPASRDFLEAREANRECARKLKVEQGLVEKIGKILKEE